MKKIILFLFVLLIPHLAHAKINIVTTTTNLGAITRAVGGDLVEVKSLCRGDQDPHFLEAKPSFAVAMNQANLLVSVGLDLEIGWLPVLLTQSRNPNIQRSQPGFLEASQGITLADLPTGAVDRSMGDVHPLGNPHYWLDPRNGIIIARAISSRLATLDPPNQATYQANEKQFESQLEAKIKEWTAQAVPLRGKSLIAYHTSLSYLANWLGLRVVGFIEPKPGIPPTAAHILELMQIIQSQGVKAIASENYYDPQAPRELAAKTGIKVLDLPTSVGGDKGIDDYFQLFDAIIAKLKGGL